MMDDPEQKPASSTAVAPTGDGIRPATEGRSRSRIRDAIAPFAVIVVLLAAVATLCFGPVVGLLLGAWFEEQPPSFEREPSPDGRYEVIRESRSGFLDSYMQLWLAERGEQDRSRWFQIAPEVDGTWHTEWLGPRELMLTDYGAWPEERPPGVEHWRDVRIERRTRPSGITCDSPDTMHRVDTWTCEDSHGRRSAARLQSNWNNPTWLQHELVPEGRWSIAATWLANDHLQLCIWPEPGVAPPGVPAQCGAIRVTTH